MSKKIITLFIFSSLARITYADYWTQKASFPGSGRESPFFFSIGNKGFLGSGLTSSVFQTDFWEYDATLNSWTQKAGFPAAGRQFASTFTINNMGYVIGGYNFNSGFAGLNDLWAYDPANNNWTQKANFGGTGRYLTVTFAVGNKGYAGVGSDQNQFNNDFWEYDPVVNTWTQKANMPGNGRSYATGFSIGYSGYVVTGYDANFTYPADFWEYVPFVNIWILRDSFPGVHREHCSGFSIADKGYVAPGLDPFTTPGFLKDFWEYDKTANHWTQKTNVPNPARGYPVSFAIGNKGFFGLGNSSSFYNDWWEYTPDTTTGITDIQSSINDIQLFPNPAKDFIKVSINNKQQKTAVKKIAITDAVGKTVYSSTIESNEIEMDVRQFAKGVYTIQVNDGKQSAVKKFLKN